MFLRRLAFVLPTLAALVSMPPTVWSQGEADLAKSAHNILTKHCFDCHGKNPKKLRGDLNLFDPTHLEDKERKILIPKKPDESELVKQIEDGSMPPGERPKLSPEEKKSIRQWVLAGGSGLTAENVVKAEPLATDLPARAKEV